MRLICILSFCFGLLLGPPFPASAAQADPHAELREIAEEAYIYAFPLVLMKKTQELSTNVARAGESAAPINQFVKMTSFPDASFTAVVRPNVDTLYSAVFYDVSAEPLIIEAPASPRYYLLPCLDFWTNVFASPGTRTTGNEALTFALTGPGWKGSLPPGVKAYRSPTALGWVIGRFQVNGASDYAAAHAFQSKLKAYPLSAWGKLYTLPENKVDPAIDMRTPPIEQVKKMSGGKFFAVFTELLHNNPPQAVDYPVLDRMKRLGIEPGKAFFYANAPLGVRAAIDAAPTNALRRLERTFARSGSEVNNWRAVLSAVGTYGADYAHRAAAAYGMLGANIIEDSIYLTALLDADGKPLDSGGRYVMHFDKGELPPARAFWSITLYDERQFLAKNDISRFAIGDRDRLVFNPDGSLDIYIQRVPPSDEKARANWLPAPEKGGFSLFMRLYWPEVRVPDGEWSPPKVQRVAP